MKLPRWLRPKKAKKTFVCDCWSCDRTFYVQAESKEQVEPYETWFCPSCR